MKIRKLKVSRLNFQEIELFTQNIAYVYKLIAIKPILPSTYLYVFVIISDLIFLLTARGEKVKLLKTVPGCHITGAALSLSSLSSVVW